VVDVIAAQSRSQFSDPAMIKLPRTFVIADGVICASIHCAQKLVYSLNASLRPPDIRKDFAVNEYSPKYSINMASL
jgi:hypothetical protein